MRVWVVESHCRKHNLGSIVGNEIGEEMLLTCDKDVIPNDIIWLELIGILRVVVNNEKHRLMKATSFALLTLAKKITKKYVNKSKNTFVLIYTD